MPRNNELTLKQRKFTKAYLTNGGNATSAVMEAYPDASYETARTMGAENLVKPLIKQAIEKALVKLDLTPEFALKGFKDITEMHMQENPNASVRALENIATIMNLYPSQKSLSLSDGSIKSLSWQE
jgi:phage terminase small subunit